MISRDFYRFEESVERLGTDTETLRQMVASGKLLPFLCFNGECAEPFDNDVAPTSGSNSFCSWQKTSDGYLLYGWLRALKTNGQMAGRAMQFNGAVVSPGPDSTPSDWFFVYNDSKINDCWFSARDIDALLEKNTTSAAVRWPWGEHTTQLLIDLAAAAKEWWSTYDPEDPGTAPTNAQVADWLVKKRDVSERVAIVMASILRADDLKDGPRPKG